MKFIHTADWHIGKSLHKQDLQDQLSLFFSWLLETIKTESIDVLLVSGDIFDLANPSAADRKMYYDFLTRLLGQKIQIIITGGNHDSVGLLNAPKEILKELNITVIGGATEELSDEIIEIKNKDGKPECIVAAVPFLRDKDLRNRETDEKYKNRTEAIRSGIQSHYEDLAQLIQKKYPNIPTIAMGHMYAIGSDPTDSERDIHVGNAAAIDSKSISNSFDYFALGHIHRPQVIGKNPYVRYSGSPIALSFSEIRDDKSIIILSLENNVFVEPEVVSIPKERELKKFKGDLESIKEKLVEYKPSYTLPSFVELEIVEPIKNTAILSAVEELKLLYQDSNDFIVLKARTQFLEGAKDTADLFQEGQHIEDLTPLDVFEKRLSIETIVDDQRGALKELFLELLETVEQSE